MTSKRQEKASAQSTSAQQETTPIDPAAFWQGLQQQGTAMGQVWMNQWQQWLGGMAATGAAAPQPKVAAPAESSEVPQPVLDQLSALGLLQEEFSMRHAQLWMQFMQASASQQANAEQGAAQAATPDKRFSAPEWSQIPYFDYLRQAYLLNADFVTRMAEAAPLEDGKMRDRLRYMTRQFVDAMAPSNFAATNPEFIKTALDTKGESITRGIQNMVEDLRKGRISLTDDSAFEVGRNLATTPGAVVYENQLIQLIQYTPTTEQVYARPLLIVPPCINKYYIMDLSAGNSMVGYLVSQGYTVFMVSWKNPGQAEAALGWNDYLQLGPISAIRTVTEIAKGEVPNALGFCIGGTLLTSALAVLRAQGEKAPVHSLTLMTTLLDFANAGEIGCLIDEASVTTRELTIGQGGLLNGRELAQTFSSLRANDLIWNYVVGNYLKGNKPPAFDLLFWNGDSTNLPGPFFAWYLRHMYLQNELREPGKLEMLGVKADLGLVDMPVYLMAAREDHIVPWQSAYLSRALLGGKTTFVLGASGHIAGAINPASRNKRSYWTVAREGAKPVSQAEEWFAKATEHAGSWWVHWNDWLAERAGSKIKARQIGKTGRFASIEPAPGRYVRESASALAVEAERKQKAETA